MCMQQLLIICVICHIWGFIVLTSCSNSAEAPADRPRMLSLEPQSLLDVSSSFLAVANACGEPARGNALQQQFLTELKAISEAVSRPGGGHAAGHSMVPKVFILEWLDPPFDAGHWVPEVLLVRTSRARLSVDGRVLAMHPICLLSRRPQRMHDPEAKHCWKRSLSCTALRWLT
jgi:hypothetical protein